MNRRNFLTIAIGGALSAMVFTSTFAASVFTGKTDGVAINGYDPVAYFTMNKPVEGVADHTSLYNGVTWRFSSPKNKALFDGDPEKYAPQYGGFCAYAVAQGATAKTEPDAFSVVGGKLYLNYSTGVRTRWETDQLTYIKQADKNWPNLK